MLLRCQHYEDGLANPFSAPSCLRGLFPAFQVVTEGLVTGPATTVLLVSDPTSGPCQPQRGNLMSKVQAELAFSTQGQYLPP